MSYTDSCSISFAIIFSYNLHFCVQVCVLVWDRDSRHETKEEKRGQADEGISQYIRRHTEFQTG